MGTRSVVVVDDGDNDNSDKVTMTNDRSSINIDSTYDDNGGTR
jgi:hypothetical protein